ncbi:MAG TPA: hypothetical protein VNY52_06185 [Solirubrobacteraceae bacterium]|jgi:hypothetical protein|nr:hypothetical protein [Solirubrobacteraceae bacterium]
MRRSASSRRAALTGALLAGLALALPLSSQATVKAKPPRASTGSALHASESTVALNATVNPAGQETTCYFQYGTSVAYGAQTPTAAAGSGVVGVKVSQPIAGLQPGTTYHYRIVASNPTGTSDGQDHTFTTKQIPLRFAISSTSRTSAFGAPYSLSGTLTGSGGAKHTVVLQASPFPYVSGFADIGTPQLTNAEGGFSLSVPSLSQTTELRVRTLDPTPVYSRAVTVHVAVLVTLRARTAKGLVRLSGTVAPAEVGAPVALQWVLPNGRFVRVAATVVRRGSASLSRFSASVAIRHGGYYRALVQVGNGRQVSGFSRNVLLRATVVRRIRRGHR